MHARYALSGLLAFAAATLVSAAPNPAPTVPPNARALEYERGIPGLGDLTSVFGSLFSDVGGFVTSEGGHVFTVLSEDGHDAFTLASGAGGVVTSVGGSVFTVATAAAGSIFTDVTSFGGKAYTVVTDKGGDAITLAESGAGFVTTVAGSVYTAATGGIPTNSGAANALRVGSGYFSGPVLVSLIAVLTGVVAGARIIV